MARLFPFSQRTAERLAAAPVAASTHRWLAQVASGLREALPAATCLAFLRRCCEVHVSHRQVPDREIEAAVSLAYGERPAAGTGGRVNYGRQAIEWPEANADVIGRVLATVEPVFDGETSTGLRPDDVLPYLFRPGELVCTGPERERASVRRRRRPWRMRSRCSSCVRTPCAGRWG